MRAVSDSWGQWESFRETIGDTGAFVADFGLYNECCCSDPTCPWQVLLLIHEREIYAKQTIQITAKSTT